MTKGFLLIVGPDDEGFRWLCEELRDGGRQVSRVDSGIQALTVAERQPPDVVVVDVALPDMDGLTLCRKLKRNPRTQSAEVIVLFPEGTCLGLLDGASESPQACLARPFTAEILRDRILGLLPQGEPATDPLQGEPLRSRFLKVGELVIDTLSRTVLAGEKPLDLTATEYRLLRLLAQEPGRVFTRQEILESISGDRFSATPRAVDVQIVGLRRKLGSAAAYIQTVRGVGYTNRVAPNR
jgi:two-component system phosphate regulon response regulator PhoB